MDTNVNNRNSRGNAVGAQTGSTGSNPDEVNNALGQLQTTLSDFVQEAQSSTKSLIALVNQMSQQLRAADSKAQQNAALIERLSSRIASNRP
jgi:hypothetical protein